MPLLGVFRAVIAGTWLLAAGCFLLPDDSGLAQAGRLLFWVLLVVHAVECVVFLPALRASGRPLPGQLLQVLLFGVAHYASLKAPETADGGDAS